MYYTGITIGFLNRNVVVVLFYLFYFGATTIAKFAHFNKDCSLIFKVFLITGKHLQCCSSCRAWDLRKEEFT